MKNKTIIFEPTTKETNIARIARYQIRICTQETTTARVEFAPQGLVDEIGSVDAQGIRSRIARAGMCVE